MIDEVSIFPTACDQTMATALYNGGTPLAYNTETPTTSTTTSTTTDNTAQNIFYGYVIFFLSYIIVYSFIKKP